MALSVLRSDLQCPLFGHGRDLKTNVLPSYEDIILCYIWLSRGKQKQYRNLATDTCKELSEKLLLVWQTASIPTVELRSVIKRIKAYHDKYRILLKPYKSRKNVESYQDRLKLFQEEAQSLFDIAACKCENFDLCKCPKKSRVPILERMFLIDQRTERRMGIGRIDLKTSAQNAKRLLRKRPHEVRPANCTEKVDSSSKHNINQRLILPDISTSSIESSDEQNEDKLPSGTSLLESSEAPRKRNIISLATVARTVDRYGVSDRAAAAIVSAAFQDVGFITKDNPTNIVDRSKIRRARDLQRQTLINEPVICQNTSFGLYFDGRKDKTLTMVDSVRRKVVVEEHISLVKEPNSEYMGHIALSSGRATVVSKKIMDFLHEKIADCDNMVVIGCDGTAVNTGSKGGVIRCIEQSLQRPLQWFICQLHANELMLRHLIEKLDGPTTGPRSFIGPIGKDLKDCEMLPLVAYEAISCTLTDISNTKDLSTDQLYLFDICNAIDSGHCSLSLSKKNPGKIVHSRWLTMANRLLRLYASTTSPTENLVHLVTFVLKVYAPMWFSIKTKPTCDYGAKHLHKTIVLSRYLPEHLKEIVDPVIQRNGFFGHTENVLLAMLADQRKHVKVLALRKILKSRDSGLRGVRQFKVPSLNFKAKDYIDIVIWNDVTVTEPPVLKNISTRIILECIETPEKIDNFINPLLKKFLCHTQATERCVKIVTEASAAVCGPIRRDGFIRTRLLSRKIMPIFETKKDFKIQ